VPIENLVRYVWPELTMWEQRIWVTPVTLSSVSNWSVISHTNHSVASQISAASVFTLTPIVVLPPAENSFCTTYPRMKYPFKAFKHISTVLRMHCSCLQVFTNRGKSKLLRVTCKIPSPKPVECVLANYWSKI
jgi:hypothetical protein